MPGVVGARFGVGPLPPFAGFLALKKPRMTRYMAQKEYFKNRQAVCRCVLPNFCATKV